MFNERVGVPAALLDELLVPKRFATEPVDVTVAAAAAAGAEIGVEEFPPNSVCCSDLGLEAADIDNDMDRDKDDVFDEVDLRTFLWAGLLS